MTKDEIIRGLKHLSWVYYMRQVVYTAHAEEQVKTSDLLAEAAGLIESFDKRRIINEFIEKVEKLAEEKMLKTGKLEGSHYAAMKQLQQEMNDE